MQYSAWRALQTTESGTNDASALALVRAKVRAARFLPRGGAVLPLQHAAASGAGSAGTSGGLPLHGGTIHAAAIAPGGNMLALTDARGQLVWVLAVEASGSSAGREGEGVLSLRLLAVCDRGLRPANVTHLAFTTSTLSRPATEGAATTNSNNNAGSLVWTMLAVTSADRPTTHLFGPFASLLPASDGAAAVAPSPFSLLLPVLRVRGRPALPDAEDGDDGVSDAVVLGASALRGSRYYSAGPASLFAAGALQRAWAALRSTLGGGGSTSSRDKVRGSAVKRRTHNTEEEAATADVSPALELIEVAALGPFLLRTFSAKNKDASSPGPLFLALHKLTCAPAPPPQPGAGGGGSGRTSSAPPSASPSPADETARDWFMVDAPEDSDADAAFVDAASEGQGRAASGGRSTAGGGGAASASSTSRARAFLPDGLAAPLQAYADFTSPDRQAVAVASSGGGTDWQTAFVHGAAFAARIGQALAAAVGAVAGLTARAVDEASAAYAALCHSDSAGLVRDPATGEWVRLTAEPLGAWALGVGATAGAGKDARGASAGAGRGSTFTQAAASHATGSSSSSGGAATDDFWLPAAFGLDMPVVTAPEPGETSAQVSEAATGGALGPASTGGTDAAPAATEDEPDGAHEDTAPAATAATLSSYAELEMTFSRLASLGETAAPPQPLTSPDSEAATASLSPPAAKPPTPTASTPLTVPAVSASALLAEGGSGMRASALKSTSGSSKGGKVASALAAAPLKRSVRFALVEEEEESSGDGDGGAPAGAAGVADDALAAALDAAAASAATAWGSSHGDTPASGGGGGAGGPSSSSSLTASSLSSSMFKSVLPPPARLLDASGDATARGGDTSLDALERSALEDMMRTAMPVPLEGDGGEEE